MSTVKGNALFLILIAVALFAALSYAVTQSGRGGGDSDREKKILLAAQAVQYASGAESAIMRMVLTGTAVTDIEFCTSANMNGLCSTTGAGASSICTTGVNCLFAPEGGGYAAETGPPGSGVNGSTPSWQFKELTNGQNMLGVGTTAADFYMSFSPDPDICDEINTRLGLALPLEDDPNGIVNGSVDGYSGEPYKCITSFGITSNPTYFHTLYAR